MVWSKYELILCLIICLFTVEAFKQTDVDYLNEEKGHQRDAGSTASTAVLLGDRILVANVGDSRVVASRAGLGWCLCQALIFGYYSFAKLCTNCFYM